MKGKAFRPVEGNTGTQAERIRAGRSGNPLRSVFNYTQNAAQHTVDLVRAGIASEGAASLYGDGCLERPISDGVWLFAGCDAKSGRIQAL